MNQNLLQMCYRYDNYLFTHAGVTKTWLKNNNYNSEQTIDEFINNLFKENIQPFGFTRGENYSSYGDDVCQTPIWVRPSSLVKDCVDNFIQVVGHTPQDDITILKNPDNNSEIVLIDTLGISGKFLTIVKID